MMAPTLRAAALALGLLLLVAATGQSQSCPPPGKADKCPVCGMFVAKYTDWLACAQLPDGRHLYFDGPKDMFRFLAEPGRFLPGVTLERTAPLQVTEFYSLKPIKAQDAWYVVGSDVYGPMGHELVPLASQADAEAFRKDHKGKRVVRFGEVNAALLKALE